MSKNQIQRLREDCKELNHDIARVKKRGDNAKAYKLAKKLDFLNQTILEQQLAQ